MSKFGPSRSELRFRLIFSLCGLAFMAGGLALNGTPADFMAWEIIVFAVLFFGGTCIWTLRKLARKDYPEEDKT